MRSKNLVPVQVILPQSQMGGNHSEQKGAFEEALQSSIEASLRTSGAAPTLRIFSSLYRRSKPHSGNDVPGTSSDAISQRALLPPPDTVDNVIDIKPDVTDLNRELSRQNRSNDDHPTTDGGGKSSVPQSLASPREQQEARGPPPLLVPQAYLRPPAVTTNSNDLSQNNRHLMQRLPSMLPKNLQIEQLKHAQEQVKHLQHLQTWHLLQQRQQQVRAVANSLSQMPRLPLYNPLMPPSALNRNTLIKPGSAINGAHNMSQPQKQQQEAANVNNQSSPGSPMFRKGYCKGGKDIRLSSLKRDGTQISPYPSEYTMVAMSILPSTPQIPQSPGPHQTSEIPSEALVVVAINIKCLPPHQQEFTRPLLAQCIGCGESSLHTFATLSSHINLRTVPPAHSNINMSAVNPLQRHARYFVLRDTNLPHVCIRGAAIPWQGSDVTPPRNPTTGPHPNLPTGVAPHRPKSNIISSQQQRPHLNYNKIVPIDGRTMLPNSQPSRPGLLPPAGVMVTHREIRKKAQPTTSSTSTILLDSSPVNGPDKDSKLPAEWSPISSDGADRSPSTSHLSVQNIRTDPDWNSTVKLPDKLPEYVGLPLILICWEWQQLQSNIPNVRITHAFSKCFEEASSECHNSTVSPLSREICYFVTAQYLATLEDHEYPSPSSLSAWLGRSRLMLSSMRHLQINASSIVALVRMAISSCLPKIGIVISQISQAHAVNECIAGLKPDGPPYHIVAHINGDSILDLSILITGHVSRLTREHLLTSNETDKITPDSLSADVISDIQKKTRASAIDSCITMLSFALNDSAHSSFWKPFVPEPSSTSHTSDMTISTAPAFSTSNFTDVERQTTSDENNNNTQTVHDDNIAEILFSHVSSPRDDADDNARLDLSEFSSIRFCFILPPSPVVKAETMTDVRSSGVLEELGIKFDRSITLEDEISKVLLLAEAESQQRFLTLCDQVKSNSSTLFVLFGIDSHLHCDTSNIGSQWMSTLTNEIMPQCRNLVIVSCTHIPQALLNQNTSIPFENVLFSKSESANVSSHDHCSSMSEISTGLTYDLKHESESILICDNFPDVHSSLLTSKLITSDYASALTLLASYRLSETGCNQELLRDAISPVTLSIMQDLLSSKSGITVLLRVPSETIGARIHTHLTNTREKLKMQKAFEIMVYESHGVPILSDYFLQVLRSHKNKPEDWCPETFVDIDCIPMLIVYTGRDVTNHLMPGNLRYVDFRLLSQNIDSMTQSSILGELSLACCSTRNNVIQIRKVHEGGSGEPPTKRIKTDSEDDALQIDTFSDNSNSDNENALKWKSFDEKDREVNESSSDSSEENLLGKKRKRGSSENETLKISEEHKESFRTPTVVVSRNMHPYIQSYLKGTQKFLDLPAHSSCEWFSHARTVVGEKLNTMQTAAYLRKWSRALPFHPDYASSDQYEEEAHALNMLLITSPRSNVALGCCTFIKKINKMLVKLLQVNVHDYQSTSSIKPCYHIPNSDLLPPWPVHANILDMDFDTSVTNATVTRASQIMNGLDETSEAKGMTSDVSSTYCMVGKYAALDSSHKPCDACIRFPFTQGASISEMSIPERGVNHQTICDRSMSLDIAFFIPPYNQDSFVFQHHENGTSKIIGLNLHLKTQTGIKTPVFSLGVSGHDHGLYNLDHASESNTDGFVTQTLDFLHVIVVKSKDSEQYKTSWPNKSLMVLPESFDDLGIGAMKYAVQCVMRESITVKCAQTSVTSDEIWPFALLLDDCAVMWMSCAELDFLSSPTNLVDDDSPVSKWRNVKLSEVLRRIESIPSVERYAAVGVRPWCSDMDTPKSEEDFSGDIVSSRFSKCHLMSCYAINAEMVKDELFDFSKFLFSDIDWFMKISKSDYPLFRFNDMAVATKVMPLSARSELTPLTESPQTLVGLADSDHRLISKHPNYLLESFLAQLGHTVFPKSRSNSRHPVLIVDCYVSLGPEVFVEYASSKPDALQWAANTEKTYSGLLLYCQSAEISANFLEQFQFTNGSTVCVVGRDRSSLRQTVVNLHLENDWHFRLTDEYQTTNDTNERKPLFYLTGVARSSK